MPPPPAQQRNALAASELDIQHEHALLHLIAEARTNFLAYLLLFNPPDSGYVLGSLHAYLAGIVQGVADGTRGDRQAISVPPQHGKQLADSTPVLTTKGWKRHGALRVGDKVFHPSGKPVEVVRLIPQHQLCTHEVTTSVGEKLKVHANHEWTVLRGRRLWKTLETREMLRQGLWEGEQGKRGSRARFQLPDMSGINMPDAGLPIPPYVLGAWLGDGKSSSPSICGVDDAVFAEVEKHFRPTSRWMQDSTGVSYSYYGGALRHLLREAFLLNNKHIPADYLLASRKQRLELLAGLLDTDGSLNRETGQYRFINTNERLIRGACDLLSSLGYTYSVTTAEPCVSSSGVAGTLPVHYVAFTPTEIIPCRVSRKQSKFVGLRRKVSIVAIRELPPEEQEKGMCVTVDSEDGLYCVGRQMVPTHNSRLMSVEAASWMLGRQPGIEIAITSFSADLAGDASKAIRARVESPLYQMVFPESLPVFGSNRVDNWRMVNGSGLKAKPAGSKLTGRRVDLLIVDDPHAGREEAESPVIRRKVETWYFADCTTRLSPNAKVFVIQTRWHKKDLVGVLTDEERVASLRAAGSEDQVFEVTNLPAVCESEYDPLGRAVGDPLFPERRDLAFLQSLRNNLPSYEWDSQFQQRPRSAGMGQADASRIPRISMDDVPFELEIVRGWDLALTEDQQADYTAGAACAYDADRDIFYIIDMIRNQRTWVRNRRMLLEQARLDQEGLNTQRVGIEGVAGFGALVQDVRHSLRGVVSVELRNPPRGGKLARAMPWLNKIEQGRVRIVVGDWVNTFITELEEFPNAENDDQIDAVSVCWEMLTGRNRNGRLDSDDAPSSLQRPMAVARPAPPPRN